MHEYHFLGLPTPAQVHTQLPLAYPVWATAAGDGEVAEPGAGQAAAGGSHARPRHGGEEEGDMLVPTALDWSAAGAQGDTVAQAGGETRLQSGDRLDLGSAQSYALTLMSQAHQDLRQGQYRRLLLVLRQRLQQASGRQQQPRQQPGAAVPGHRSGCMLRHACSQLLPCGQSKTLLTTSMLACPMQCGALMCCAKCVRWHVMGAKVSNGAIAPLAIKRTERACGFAMGPLLAAAEQLRQLQRRRQQQRQAGVVQVDRCRLTGGTSPLTLMVGVGVRMASR